MRVDIGTENARRACGGPRGRKITAFKRAWRAGVSHPPTSFVEKFNTVGAPRNALRAPSAVLCYGLTGVW